MQPQLETELTSSRFAELGHPYRVVRDRHRGLLAVASSFEYLAWPGRTFYEGQKLWSRVSLYRADNFELVGVVDFKYGVNDFAFHPTDSKMAIGTGGYDGGFMFLGELLLWDWESGGCSSLLGESRDVVRCRFDESGAIKLLLRPRDEEEYAHDVDHWDAYIGASISDFTPAKELGFRDSWIDPRLVDLPLVEPSQWGFEKPDNVLNFKLPDEDGLALRSAGFEERGVVWDLLWLDDDRFAAVHTSCQAEVWNPREGWKASISGEGFGVELLPRPEGGCWVHVLIRGDIQQSSPDQSCLYVLRDHELEPVRRFDRSCTFSTDASGRILARDVGYIMRRDRSGLDRVLRPDGSTVLEEDLGYFDSINHPLKLCGGAGLYFLRGTPPDSHKGKTLCAIDSQGTVQSLFAWDRPGAHLARGLALLQPGDRFVRSCRVYGENHGDTRSVLESCSIATGEVHWSLRTTGHHTAIAIQPELALLAYATTDGEMGLVQVSSGKSLWNAPASVRQIPTVITSMQFRGSRLLAGTIEGRILLYRLVS